MTAFPQLGYGYKSNTSHIATEKPTSEVAIMWWRHCLTDDQKVDLIVKKHPQCLNQSGLMRFSLWKIYNENPQKLYDDWIKENEPKITPTTKKKFSEWLNVSSKQTKE